MQSAVRNDYLAACGLQLFICVVSCDSHGKPTKYYYVHTVHGENETYFGYEQIRVSDLFGITQLESNRAGNGV